MYNKKGLNWKKIDALEVFYVKFCSRHCLTSFRLNFVFFFLLLVFSHPGNAEVTRKKMPVEEKKGKNITQDVKPSPVNGEECIISSGNESENSLPFKKICIPEKKNLHNKTNCTKGREPDKVMRTELAKAFSDKDYELVRKIVEANPELAKSTPCSFWIL